MAVFTNYIAPNSAYYLTLNVIEKIPDDYVTSNKTKVDVVGSITGVKSAYSSSYSSSTNTVNVNGRLFYPNTAYSVSNGRTAEIFRYNDIEIEHEADGSKKINVSWSFNGNTNGSYNPNGSVSGEVTLTTIPRATKLAKQMGTIGDTLKISWSQASPNFKHSLIYTFGSKSGTIGNKITNYIDWNIPTSFYQQMKDSPSKDGKLLLVTYNNDIEIGRSTAVLTVLADETKVSPQISESNVIDINPNTTELTGDNGILIKNNSVPFATIDFNTKEYAILKTLVINKQDYTTDVVKLSESSGTTTYRLEKEIPVSDKSEFDIVITDSRDFSVSDVIKLDLIDYVDLDCLPTFKRIQPTTGEVGLEFDGKYFNDTFGDVRNTLKISYAYKIKEEESYSNEVLLYENTDYKIVNNTFHSGSSTYKSQISLGVIFDYKKVYNIILYVEDKLTKLVINALVVKGIPIFWWNGEKVTINGDLYIADTDGNNPVNVKDNLDVVVDNLDSNATNKAPSQRAVNDVISGIVESGSNSNGSYTKFSDGTLICKKAVTVTATMKAWFGNLYYDDLSMGNWAHSFADTNGPIVNATINNNQYWLASCAYYSNTSAGTCRILRMNELNQSVTFNIIGFGRWK